jgi:hypothetical protein
VQASLNRPLPQASPAEATPTTTEAAHSEAEEADEVDSAEADHPEAGEAAVAVLHPANRGLKAVAKTSRAVSSTAPDTTKPTSLSRR